MAWSSVTVIVFLLDNGLESLVNLSCICFLSEKTLLLHVINEYRESADGQWQDLCTLPENVLAPQSRKVVSNAGLFLGGHILLDLPSERFAYS